MIGWEENFVFSFFFCLTLNLKLIADVAILQTFAVLITTPHPLPQTPPKSYSTNPNMQNDSQACFSLTLKNEWVAVLTLTVHMFWQIPKVTKVNFFIVCVHGNWKSMFHYTSHTSQMIFYLSYKHYWHFAPQF